jgi:D-amino-acid oxidase
MQPATQAILERARRLEPALANATVLGAAVGLRPSRPAIRLEREVLPDGRRVVHNYGHGGHGFSLAWGCAAAVTRLVAG